MVIWFNIKEAREQLQKHGIVYTIRSISRREGRDAVMWDKFKKRGLAEIKFIRDIRSERDFFDWMENSDLALHALENSGFKNPQEWINKTDKQFPMGLFEVSWITEQKVLG